MPEDAMKDDVVGPRRHPVQECAKDRVTKILAATELLLKEVGLRDLKMNHIARRAGVPIGSVYQYFPNREAILRALVDDHHARYTEALRTMCDQVRDFPGLITTSRQAFEMLAANYKGSGAYRALWSGAQGFEPLRALDIEDTRRNAAVICAAMLRVMPGLDPGRALTACILLCDFAGSITRLATELEPDMEAGLMTEASVMATDYVTNLFRGQLES